jgi:hypothetical protein
MNFSREKINSFTFQSYQTTGLLLNSENRSNVAVGEGLGLEGQKQSVANETSDSDTHAVTNCLPLSVCTYQN